MFSFQLECVYDYPLTSSKQRGKARTSPWESEVIPLGYLSGVSKIPESQLTPGMCETKLRTTSGLLTTSLRPLLKAPSLMATILSLSYLTSE